MTATIRLATAPVRWGIMQETSDRHWPTWRRVLDEIAQLGFTGTELGPYGFYLTDPAQLHDELVARNLTLTSAFVPIGLFNPARQEADIQLSRHVAALLQALDCPYIVLADAMKFAGAPEPDTAAWEPAAHPALES